MKIGILICGHTPEELSAIAPNYHSLFEQFLDGKGFTFQSWNVVDMDFPTDLRQADGWLVTGSRHGAYEDHPWIPPLEDFIRKVYAEGRPMVGICFGHQIIAQALGGRVEKFDGGWAVGRRLYEMGGETVALNAWHQDQVVTRPEGAQVVGSNSFCENAALLYGNRVFTVQPHPEFDDAFIDGLIAHRGKGVVPEDRLSDAARNLGQPNDNRRLAARIADFFHATVPA